MEDSIGYRIRAWRHALGLTQAAFSERIGVHIGVLKKYEQGLNIPGGEALAAIAKTGVNMNWLLTGDGEMRQGTEQLDTSVVSPKGSSDVTYKAHEPSAPLCAAEPAPPPYAREPRRWQSIIALVEAIDDDARREALMTELFSRAQDAAELADMRRQLAELKKKA